MQLRIFNFLLIVVIIVLISLTSTIEARGGRKGGVKPASGKGGEVHGHLVSINLILKQILNHN